MNENLNGTLYTASAQQAVLNNRHDAFVSVDYCKPHRLVSSTSRVLDIHSHTSEPLPFVVRGLANPYVSGDLLACKPHDTIYSNAAVACRVDSHIWSKPLTLGFFLYA